MLVSGYKEFVIGDIVKVKKELIYDIFLSSLTAAASKQLSVIDYVMSKDNKLTIIEIDSYPATNIIQAYFSFFECKGNLFYGQFSKYLPTFYMLNKKNILQGN